MCTETSVHYRYSAVFNGSHIYFGIKYRGKINKVQQSKIELCLHTIENIALFRV